MTRRLPWLLACCIAFATPLTGAPAEPTLANSAKDITQQNPLIDDVARNDPDGLRSLLRRLEVLTTGQRDSGPARSGSVATSDEATQIRTNPLLNNAYSQDPAAALALLRATNEALSLARHREQFGSQRRIALVIGNSGDSAWGILGNVRNDTRLIAAALSRQGFELFKGHAWLDLDRQQLRQVIRDFSRSATPDTVALIYFAGHGVRSNGHNFLVPADAAMPRSDDDYDKELVAVDDVVLRQMQQTGDRLNIIVLDACEDRPAAPSRAYASYDRRKITRGFASISPPGAGTMVIYSTEQNDVARDSVAQAPDSPFATAFAAAVSEPGLEIRDVFDRVAASVGRATNHRQQPWIAYSAIDRFYFGAPDSPGTEIPSAAIDGLPFHCPAAGATVALGVAGATVIGAYESTDPTDPVLCRVNMAGETRSLLYNFFDVRLLLGQASARAAMNDLLSRHRDQVEFDLPYTFMTRSLETWKRLGTEMLPIDGHYARTVKFERASQLKNYNIVGEPAKWFIWYDPIEGLFVKSERAAPSRTQGLGDSGMPGVFKVMSFTKG